MSRLIGILFRGAQKLWSRRSFVARALLCWIVGIIVLVSERSDDFDLRFHIRGAFLKSDEITLIHISEDEWLNLRGRGFQTLRPLKEIESISDRFFADRLVWAHVLQQLLKYQPKAIGISLFVDEAPPLLTEEQLPVLRDPRVYWAARIDSDGQLQRPRFAPINDQRLGLLDFKPDSDGYVRRVSIRGLPMEHLAQRLASKLGKLDLPYRDSVVINFQGPSSTFLSFTMTELLFGTLPESALKNKIVIIGARGTPTQSLLTPLGAMTRAEILANATHTLAKKQWIRTLPNWIYAAFLLAMLALSIWLVVSYSQYMALLFMVSVWGAYIVLSTWAFDAAFIWLPLVAPTLQLAITFVVFLSYQLVVNERENWELQQEKRYLEELEEMKNNFLSLVSHDLKTPIAKIQGVADRLMANSKDQDIIGDLRILKGSSQDLFRYIQSLLQVTRVESTDFHARKTPTDINELLKKVVDELSPIAQERGLSLVTDFEPMFSIELDPTLIYEVALNLVENAIKYTPAGGTVKIVSKEVDQRVVVSIEDTGEGIPSDEVTKVWEKFYRGKKHDGTTKGSGLGLYLSKYFIELHGGKVFLESHIGDGTKIGFELPLDEQETEV